MIASKERERRDVGRTKAVSRTDGGGTSAGASLGSAASGTYCTSSSTGEDERFTIDVSASCGLEASDKDSSSAASGLGSGSRSTDLLEEGVEDGAEESERIGGGGTSRAAGKAGLVRACVSTELATESGGGSAGAASGRGRTASTGGFTLSVGGSTGADAAGKGEAGRGASATGGSGFSFSSTSGGTGTAAYSRPVRSLAPWRPRGKRTWCSSASWIDNKLNFWSTFSEESVLGL